MEAIDTVPTAETVQPATGSAPRHAFWWWLGTFGGAFLGIVLLVAVWAKALDPAAFVEQIHTEGLDGFLLPAQAVALIALALEAGLGLALVLGVRRKWVLVPATLLVAFFLFLTGRSWWLAAHGLRTDAASCGCFGNLVQRTPAEAFRQDAAAAGAVAGPGLRGARPPRPAFPAAEHRRGPSGRRGGGCLRLEVPRAAARQPGDAAPAGRRHPGDLRRRRRVAGLPELHHPRAWRTAGTWW